MTMEQIVIVIPAYEPDRRLITLLTNLKQNHVGFVVLVDDGSGDGYKEIFQEAELLMENLFGGGDGVLLTHDQNKGKGRALKTAFGYILDCMPEVAGVVTADSDGQHSVEAICNIKETLLQMPDHLVLGVRDFGKEGIPWKSRFGNNLTEKVFAYLSGVHVSDTQTGLRGIPRALMERLLDVEGERFEFEMRMLLECAGKYQIMEIPIETIYDSKENHQTHFHPVRDSIKIYKILGAKFLKYIVASFSSSILDLVLFSIVCMALKSISPTGYIVVATVTARIISAIFNCIVNYKVVFCSEEPMGAAGIKYAVLAIFQMGLSAALVTYIVKIFVVIPEVAIKAIIDIMLFFASYYIQRKYVFAKSN